MKRNKSQSPGPVYYVPWLSYIFKNTNTLSINLNHILSFLQRWLLFLTLSRDIFLQTVLNRKLVDVVYSWRDFFLFLLVHLELASYHKNYLIYIFLPLKFFKDSQQNNINSQVKSRFLAYWACPLRKSCDACQLNIVFQVKTLKMGAESSSCWNFQFLDGKRTFKRYLEHL